MTDNLLFTSDYVDENVRKLLVPIIYLAVLLTIGVPGNFIVLIIYKHKYAKCVYRTIIWNLAVADLTFCTIGIPFNIARAVHFSTFTSLWACKIFTTLLVFGIMYSTHLLMLLSLHRFRQICMPLKTQITTRTAYRWIIVCGVIATILSIPQFVLEKTETIALGVNVTGSTCPITPSHPSIYWTVNNMTMFTLFMIYTISLFIMYTFIGRKIYLHRKKRLPIPEQEFLHHTSFSRKMTKIAFTISVVFAASYLPLFLLRLVKNSLSEDSLTSVEFAVLRIGERLYMVNHVANPFVYAIFDQRFRQQFRELATLKFRSQSIESSTSKSQDYTTSITL